MFVNITLYIILEDRGAQAPLILAPAEGFRGPLAPFGTEKLPENQPRGAEFDMLGGKV